MTLLLGEMKLPQKKGSALLRGRWGEAVAAAYLREKGYEIVAANYRTRFGEIDLIACKGDMVVFVEVKLRASADFARPMEFVTPAKQQKIVLTAGQWLIEHGEGKQPRFDVIEIIAPERLNEPPVELRHIENAFQS